MQENLTSGNKKAPLGGAVGIWETYLTVKDPAAHPAVGLVHEGARYDARWFAGVNYQASDPWPKRVRFADDADFEAWLARIMSESIVPADVHPCACDRLLVCTTCSNDYPPCDTYAALAVVEEETVIE